MRLKKIIAGEYRTVNPIYGTTFYGYVRKNENDFQVQMIRGLQAVQLQSRMLLIQVTMNRNHQDIYFVFLNSSNQPPKQ